MRFRNGDVAGGEERRLARRTLMRMVGVGAVTTSLAGCQEATQQSYEFTAEPVVYGGDPGAVGYTEETRETVTAERTESIAGVEATVTVNSQVAIYSSERDTEPKDVEGLWSADEGPLAAWTDGAPARGGHGPLTSSTTTRWSPSPRASAPRRFRRLGRRCGCPSGARGELDREDLLVAWPAPEEWTPTGADRDSYQFGDDVFFPSRGPRPGERDVRGRPGGGREPQ